MAISFHTRIRSFLLAAGVVAAFVSPAVAATLRSGFTEILVASGLASPTAMAFAPDGRLFVCQQGGQLRVIENGTLLPTPFVSVVVNASGERGLLGVAFDPNFTSNQFVYVYYTATTPTIHNRVSRFTANGNVAVAGSEFVLMELPTLSATNHNGGAMHFSLDGKLYVAVGENAVGQNSQVLTNPLGKMLRINQDGSIPTDNPFYTQTTGISRAIWALGLRNPFTFSFQPTSGRMFINDVGQVTWEEINDGARGANYGWPNSEGPTKPAGTNYTLPVYSYAHGSGPFQGCAITGGTFYAGLPAQYPAEYVGDYFFADYCTGWINQLDETGGVITVTTFASGIPSPVDLAVGPEGNLYYLARGSGSVFRINFTGGQAPAITQHPANRTVSAGQSASFTVAASGAPPLSYQWQRNGVSIGGATSATYTLSSAALSDNGAQFRAIVTNTAGSATSNAATLTVVANQPPVPTIIAPASGAQYTAGTTLGYSGSAADPEDGALGASRFTWEIVFHHDTHTHPFLQPTSGATSGSVTIPNTGETAANVFYRVHLTVVDSGGRQATTYRDVLPRTVQLTLAASPSGATLTLDGQPVTAPHTFIGVVGMRRTIGAASPITVSNKIYDFLSWSDGLAQTHAITTPAANQTYTATYKRRKGRP
jgi:glucose/arabinose dehydrogenase